MGVSYTPLPATVPAFASAAEAKAGVATTVVLSPADLANYVAPQTLVDAATVAFDVALGVNGILVIAGNRTLGNPTNLKAGQSGLLRIVQGSGGNHTLAYASNWKVAGGAAPVLSTAEGDLDRLAWWYDGTTLHLALANDVS